MILFLLVFFSLYGGLHLYTFLKLKNTFTLTQATLIPLALFMLLMTFAPLIIRISERGGLEFFAQGLSWICYLWMAVIFLFFSFSVFSDICLNCYFRHQCIFKFIAKNTTITLQELLLSTSIIGRISFFISLFLSVSLTIYGYVDALNIRLERIEIKTDRIGRSLRIVQISDVHLGLIVREGRLKRILEKVREANPDMVVSTGDLVDGQIDRLEGLAELLKEVNPPYGKYAITGNHEFYAGLKQALAFTEKAGFTILRGEAVYLPELKLTIAGVDDPAGRRYGLTIEIPEERLLKNLSGEGFVLLLKHRPIVESSSKGLFDLQLSGHTHKGQIFPFTILTSLYYKKDSGFLKDMNGVYLYVSRGAGTWGPPVRVFAPPEITVIDIVKK